MGSYPVLPVSRKGTGSRCAAVFMPALVASRFDPALRTFYQHLLARQIQTSSPHRCQAQTAARHLRHVPSPTTLLWPPALPHFRPAGMILKREVLLHFSREQNLLSQRESSWFKFWLF